jgi:hypothetical protein
MGEQHRKDLENRHEEVRDLEKVKYLAWSLQRGARTPAVSTLARHTAMWRSDSGFGRDSASST